MMRLPSLLFFGLLTLLAGCGGQLMQRALDRVVTPDMETQGIGEIEALTAAHAPEMIVWMLDVDRASRLLLAEERDGVLNWRTLDNVRFYTRDGLIIGTRGLGFDLMTADNGNAAAVIASGRAGQVPRVHRLLDGEDNLAIRSYICDIRPVGAEQVQTDVAHFVTALRVDETCHSPRGNIENRHWVLNGRILQTEQTFSQDLGRFRILYLP
ncbi:YjbF family lipoprotein [Paracoccus sp. IB05]|uniref:YjbF family lipoprotein n=1 Tax=Paracoccus sp. IB05 TaxID=2779367 RepID=UPI0018E81C5B|nr:YjbF family lipoprotein [Paracoccus sp. IB05]MBJ2152214.1 YjbF family lipoprotein [Paracoccus sp. IB05]